MEFIINGDSRSLSILDEDAAHDAEVNCASFNYGNDDYWKKDLPITILGGSTHDLDVPAAVELARSLREKGFEIPENVLSKDDIVRFLCQ